MIGDLWVSPRTGNVYRVGQRGTAWAVVGHASQLHTSAISLPALLGFAGAAAGLSIVAAVAAAAMTGLLLGAIVMYFPVAIPFSIPVLFLLMIGLAIRSLATRRPLMPVGWMAAAFGVLLVIAVLHVVFWRTHAGLYVQIASLPLMAVLTFGLAVWACARKRWALTALLVCQALVFASSYLGSAGRLTYSESSTGFDNLLALAYWVCLACAAAAWLTPRRTLPQGMETALEACPGAMR